MTQIPGLDIAASSSAAAQSARDQVSESLAQLTQDIDTGGIASGSGAVTLGVGSGDDDWIKTALSAISTSRPAVPGIASGGSWPVTAGIVAAIVAGGYLAWKYWIKK